MSNLFSLLLQVGGWVGGSLENWRVILISAFNYVIVEVVAEIGNIKQSSSSFSRQLSRSKQIGGPEY